MNLLRPKQAYDYLNGAIPLSTIYHYLETGKIPGRKPFGRWLIRKEDLDRLLDPPAQQVEEPTPAEKPKERKQAKRSKVGQGFELW